MKQENTRSSQARDTAPRRRGRGRIAYRVRELDPLVRGRFHELAIDEVLHLGDALPVVHNGMSNNLVAPRAREPRAAVPQAQKNNQHRYMHKQAPIP